jgi:hypothetical protein
MEVASNPRFSTARAASAIHSRIRGGNRSIRNLFLDEASCEDLHTSQ